MGTNNFPFIAFPVFKLFNSGLIFGLFLAFLAQSEHFWEPKGLFLSLVSGQKSFLKCTCINTQLSFHSVSCVQTIQFRPNFWFISSLFGPIWPFFGAKGAVFVIGMRPKIIFRVYLYKCTTFLL